MQSREQKVKLSKKLEKPMPENEKDENPLIESQENVEQSDVRVAEISVQLCSEK